MIFCGTKVTLRPNRRYKDRSELNEDIQLGEDRFGAYQQCQVLDMNRTDNEKTSSGFFYCRFHTDISLIVGDKVTVDKILYVQRKRNIAVIAVTIKESTPNYKTEILSEDDILDF